MNKVFLSHSSSDKFYVEHIANKFGKDIAIYDEYSFEGGLRTLDEIMKEMDQTDLFVIFLSDSALDSDWVKKELNLSNELKQNKKLKQIYPIIIDPKISYDDPRIPKWLNEGFGAYNLRYISSPKIAYRKIKYQLVMLNNQETYNRYSVYVGHEDILKKFDDEYYTAQKAPKCMIACGIEGVGREAFIRESIKVPRTFSETYEPIVINVDLNDSIDVILSKLIDNGFGDSSESSMKEINALSMDEKVAFLTSIFSQIQNSKEFVIFRDNGTLIQHGEVVGWLADALGGIRNELTIGIVSIYNVHKSNTSRDCYIEKIAELDESGKLKLLDQLSKSNGLSLDREDIRFFKNIVSGHPLQIIFCVEKIKRESLEEVKRSSFEIKDFLSDSTIKIIDKYLALLNYDAERRKKFLSYLAFLAGYSNIPIAEVLDINKLDPDYDVFYHDLLSFCIARRTGLNNDMLSISPSVVDYIDRNRIEKPEDIRNYLKKEYSVFRRCLRENDLDEYCYSQIEQYLKEMIVSSNQEDYKFIYPSIILKAVVQLYNKQEYRKVKAICEDCMVSIEVWDPSIRNAFYFYYAMAAARLKDSNIFEIVFRKIEDKFILEKFQADFIRGFYYKLIGNCDEAIKQFLSCLETNPNYVRARRELVETYVMIEEFDLAVDLAYRNYLKYPDNIFNIYQYFNCLIRGKHDREKIQALLEKASAVDRFPTSSKQFYVAMKALYDRFITHDYNNAIRYLLEHKSSYDNLIYYYRDLFDLYVETRNVAKMRETLESLRKAIGTDNSYLPLLFRRECILLYFQNKNLALVKNKILTTSGIPESAKTKTLNYLSNIKL